MRSSTEKSTGSLHIHLGICIELRQLFNVIKLVLTQTKRIISNRITIKKS